MICIDSPVKHDFTFTPSMSIILDCEDACELNKAFNQLSSEGEVLDAARQLRIQYQVRVAE
jgi:predicted 3-demethylubiquinone-9 3-methyltransferase (glyoxalase superfamily)